jgi:hypothetical protein
MDEATWLSGADPRQMLLFLRGRVSERKMRLLICACCRRVWDLLGDDRSRRAVEVAERYADGLADGTELLGAKREANAAYLRARKQSGPAAFRLCGAAHLALQAVAQKPRFDPREDEFLRGAKERKEKVERTARSDLVRDLLGNPFRPLVADPSWRTPTITSLARSAHAERCLPAGTLETDRLAVLADALEEAGCVDTTIMTHLRWPGPHVRGCFVLDLLLGRKG